MPLGTSLRPRREVRLWTALAVCALTGLVHPARAAVIYYESFTESSYPVVYVGTDPNVGGTWTNTTGNLWGGGTADDQIVSGSLAAPAGSAALSSTGGKLNFEGDDSKRSFSSLTSGVGDDNTTVYASFLINLTLGNSGTAAFTGLEFYQYSTSATNRQVKAGWMNDTYAVTKRGDEEGVDLVSGQINFVVLKFNFVSGNDTVDVYINPTQSTLLAGDYTKQLTGLDFSFNYISLANFNDEEPSGYVDEIRVGELLTDVALIIPEPDTLSLMMLMGMGLIAWSRLGRRGMPRCLRTAR